MKTLLNVLCALSGSVALATKPSFKNFTCEKVISDKLVVTTTAKELSFRWTTRGDEGVTKLLRALANPSIPTSLLKAYGQIVVEVAIPTESCQFGETGSGRFSCDFKGEDETVEIELLAKVSPYGEEEADVYSGELSSFKLSSSFFGKKDSRYLKFPVSFIVDAPKSAKVSTETNFFFAHYWESEGFRQDPSCLLDKVPLVD